jgi:enterochelin esterase-like enzyme
MKSLRRVVLLLMTTLGAVSGFARSLVSPEVTADGRVTFRLAAPDAQSVVLRCEALAVETAMVRGESGVWSFTTEALEPDIYTYSFVVDGARMTDPANPLLKYNLLNSDSEVHVPGPASLPWELNDVPRGVVHRHFFRSKVVGDERDFLVYTPPGYKADGRTRYPVLYLLHGYSDDATAWSTVGRANVILDNLIARGEAQPMVVVMPLGYGSLDIVRAGWNRERDPAREDGNVDTFARTLLEEVMPQVEAEYAVARDREHRAIAGLSMGGRESLIVGLNHLETFAWVGAFSPGGFRDDFPTKFPGLEAADNKRLCLLWIGCGTEDGLINMNRRVHAWLDEKGVRHTWVETPGAHTFRVWRRYLAQLAPQLFQPRR